MLTQLKMFLRCYLLFFLVIYPEKINSIKTGPLPGETLTKLNLYYLEGTLMDEALRTNQINEMHPYPLLAFCRATHYLKINYLKRWDIRRQLTFDMEVCEKAKKNYQMTKNEDLTEEVGYEVFPIITPAAASQAAIPFPIGMGMKRDNELKSLDEKALKLHCETVKNILFLDYIPEYKILDQLSLDYEFCTKTKVLENLKNRGIDLPEEKDLDNKIEVKVPTIKCYNSNDETTTKSPEPIPPEPNNFVMPWGFCRLVINELNTNTPNFNIGQFIELLQVCNSGKFAKRNSLEGFWILIINGEKRQIILSQSLQDYKLNVRKVHNQRIKLFTIGAHGVVRADMQFKDASIAYGNDYLPIGDDSPYAVVLLYGKINELTVLNLPTIANQYQPLKLTSSLIEVIKQNLQDMVVYGTTPIHQKCSVFEEIYPFLAAPDCTDVNNICLYYLLRDWQNPNAHDKSLNRCTMSILPIVPTSFRYANPTPGELNDCQNSFPFRLEDHILDMSDIIERVVGTNPTDSNCRSELYTPQTFAHVEGSKYQQQFEKAEHEWSGMEVDEYLDVDANLEMEIETMDDKIENSGHQRKRHRWECDNENPFDLNPNWKKNIVTYQKNLLDVNTIESCEVKPWFWYYPDTSNPELSKYGCKFCAEMLQKKIATINPGKIEKIMQPEGMLINKGTQIIQRNNIQMLKHPNGAYHKLAMHVVREKEWYETEEELIEALKQPGSKVREYYRATEEIIAAVYQAAKMNLSFSQYEDLIEYIKKRLNVNVGIHYHDAKSMERIIGVISEEMHFRLINHLLEKSLEISIILDSSEDVEGRHYMAVLFQTFDQNTRPHVYFYKLLEIGVSETASSLFKLLWDQIGEDGLQGLLRNKLRGYSSDGAAVVKSALLNLMKTNINPNIVGNHCSAHRLDLVTKHAFQAFPFIDHLDDIVNDQHNFLNGRSLKLHAKLKEIIIEEDDTFFKLHKLFPVRWISSKFDTIKPIINHWSTLIATYNSIETDKRFKNSQREKAKELKNELLKRPVLATLTKVEDLCELFKTFSQNFQIETSTPIPVKEYKKAIHKTLENQKNMHGTLSQEFFDTIECEKNGKIIVPCTIQLFEDENTKVTYLGYELTFVKYDDENPEYPPISILIPKLIDALHQQMIHYFPDDIFDNFSIFYPKQIPVPGTSMNDFGKKELIELKSVFKWPFSEKTMITDWEQLIASMRLFSKLPDLQTHPLHAFWFYYYNNAKQIRWTEVTREIVRTVQVIPGSSATAERVFSIQNVIKSPRRSSLSPKALDALIRLKYNGPDCVDDIDIFSYAKTWTEKHFPADDSSRASSNTADKRKRCQACDSQTCNLDVMYYPSSIF